MNWTYNASDYQEKSFTPLKAGDYRIRINEVTEKVSAKGNEMLEIVMDVSGSNSKLWYYLVFMPDNVQFTNQRIGELFRCFGLPNNALENIGSWIGKVGACRVKIEDDRARIHYLIAPDRATKLPAWEEPSNGSAPQAQPASGLSAVTEDIPW